MYTTFNSLMSLLGFPYDEDAYREKALKSTKSFRDMVTNSKTISGSFDKLNEDEQQKVVDSFNKVNDLFGEFFGITPERYTKDVFKGANVSVTTSGDEEDKVKNAEYTHNLFLCHKSHNCCDCGSCFAETERSKNPAYCITDNAENAVRKL